MTELFINIKDKLTPYALNICYKLLYGVSVCQIQIKKMKNLLIPHIKSVEKYLKNNNIIIELRRQIIKIIDKDGNVAIMLVITDKISLEDITNIFEPNKHRVLLLYDKNYETGCVNKIFYEKSPIIINYKESNVKFMMVELENENGKHVIELKNNAYNYYIVNNSLNQNFFKYYLKNVLKVPINKDNFDYTVTIIDHNVNMLTLLPEQYIIFNEHDYSVFPKTIDIPINDTIDIPINDTIDIPIIDTVNNDEQSSIDSDKYDDFIKLEVDN